MSSEKSNKGVILIVDDNPTNLGVLFESLTQSGYRVLIAQDGELALRQVERVKPDIILLDVLMPGIDGFETCRRLKVNDDTREIPVIFMTALSDTVDKIKGFEIGAVDYITKPFQQEEVRARIHAHLTIQNLQRQLQSQNEVLQELNNNKDRFFSIISHDLRGQFATLFILTDLLSDSCKDSEGNPNQLLTDVRQVVQNTFKLLENLLDWALLQRGKMEFYPEMIDLKTIVESTVKLFEENARQKQIRIQAKVVEHLKAYADEKMVNTILRNLINNAIKFTRENGEITVQVQDRADGFMQIAVTDTGIGIEPTEQEKLFRIDVKYQKSGTAQETGTGLGLILCKELVEKNGGRIWVESEKDKGSTFTFTLPATPDSD